MIPAVLIIVHVDHESPIYQLMRCVFKCNKTTLRKCLHLATQHRPTATNSLRRRRAMAEKLATQFPPHVLLFPFPLQGHITPMLHLAELLSLGGLDVTFINTVYNHKRLFGNANFQSHFRRYTGFRFESISDGLPGDQPRSEDKRLLDIHASLRAHAKPVLKELISSGRLQASGGRGPVSCVIADGILGFVREVAEDLGIPMIYFRTVCASAVWTFFSIPNLIQAKELPFQGL